MKIRTMKDIGIFIKNSKGTMIQIPVNPSEINIKGDGDNENMNIVGLGEITLINKRKLQDIEWESWFPFDTWYPGVRTKKKFKQPEWYVKFLENIRKSCKPCQLIITGLNIDMDVTIEQFDYSHKAGEHEDKYYSIKLKEYKPYDVIVIPAEMRDLKRWGSSLGSKSSGTTAKKSSKITVGSIVVLNGPVYNNSKGSKVGSTYYNYIAKCTLIEKGAKYPYFLQSQTNRWLGWANKNGVELG